jgi:hypothetical protein
MSGMSVDDQVVIFTAAALDRLVSGDDAVKVRGGLCLELSGLGLDDGQVGQALGEFDSKYAQHMAAAQSQADLAEIAAAAARDLAAAHLASAAGAGGGVASGQVPGLDANLILAAQTADLLRDGGGGGGAGLAVGVGAAAAAAALIADAQRADAQRSSLGVAPVSPAASVAKSRLEKYAEDNEVYAQSQIDWIDSKLNMDFCVLCNHFHPHDITPGAKGIALMPYVDIRVLSLFRGVFSSCVRDTSGKIGSSAMYDLCSHFSQRHGLCGFRAGSLMGRVNIPQDVSDFIDGTGCAFAALKSMRVNPCTVGDVWMLIDVFKPCILRSCSEIVYPEVDMSSEPF